jgi:pSer/pThr/pTyr-binding forkhead associated (FHA) protein
MAQHCPECGFVNGEGANYCQRCGTLLRGEAVGGASSGAGGDPVTATYRIDETGELVPVELGDVTAHGPALVIRAGGGRVGESFALQGERMSIGRRPDSDVFLDDITVSRDHALLIHRGDMWHLDDCGSLNGTYVNRERIESHRLEEGDEVQIGKYKLTFHAR